MSMWCECSSLLEPLLTKRKRRYQQPAAAAVASSETRSHRNASWLFVMLLSAPAREGPERSVVHWCVRVRAIAR